MLDQTETIDFMKPIPPDAFMMGVLDYHPWDNPDSNERLEQFRLKLETYCRYIMSEKFRAENPKVHRTKVAISVITTVPPSERMKKITAVYTDSNPRYERLVLFAGDGRPASEAKSEPAKSSIKKLWDGLRGVR